MSKSILVTGGTGFLGSALVRRLVRDGHRVRVLDNNSRGVVRRLADILDDCDYVQADIRNPTAVANAIDGVDCVCHLAHVNGTRFFYEEPELVLDVGVKGIINVIDGCLEHDVGDLVVASSSEVYQTPPVVPTDETAPLSVPDITNPRYSYGGSKILSELMTMNFGRKHFERAVIFRPHNVYGPDMGGEHVLPEFILRMRALKDHPHDPLKFPIQGTGQDTRAFVFIDDFIDGLMLIIEKGEHLGIYHVGTSEEITIRDVAVEVGRYFDRDIEVVPGPPALGGTARRCPDISKLKSLGFAPRVSFKQGIPIIAKWYDENAAIFGNGAAE